MEAYSVPVDPADLRAVAELLRAADVFTPSFCAPEVDLYDPVVYLQQTHRFATDTALRLDRNVFTRMLAVARGEPLSEAHRMAAAVVAFAQCAGVLIEPNMPLYEAAQRFGQAEAVGELALFRRADHADPAYWTDVALMRAERLAYLPQPGFVSTDDDEPDFTMPLRRWRRNYVLCLKLAELELAGGDAAARFRRFVRWAYEDFIMGGPAITLAAHYLAPNAPRKRLLKGLRSPDRHRAIDGIRNAAWDVTLISEWLLDIEAQHERARLVLLTSLDTGVHRLARAVADPYREDEPPEGALREVLCRLWGDTVGARLADEVLASYGSLEAPGRRANSDPLTTIEEYIERGEAIVTGWTPRQGDV